MRNLSIRGKVIEQCEDIFNTRIKVDLSRSNGLCSRYRGSSIYDKFTGSWTALRNVHTAQAGGERGDGLRSIVLLADAVCGPSATRLGLAAADRQTTVIADYRRVYHTMKK